MHIPGVVVVVAAAVVEVAFDEVDTDCGIDVGPSVKLLESCNPTSKKRFIRLSYRI